MEVAVCRWTAQLEETCREASFSLAGIIVTRNKTKKQASTGRVTQNDILAQVAEKTTESSECRKRRHGADL